MLRHLHACAALLPGGLLAVHPARAAESYEACTGFIDSLPATITTQGVWCLRKDLATNITSGNAITIATSNVTIDCNGFKLGGLAAGNTSRTSGVCAAEGRQNVTVRHCSIRGFLSSMASSCPVDTSSSRSTGCWSALPRTPASATVTPQPCHDATPLENAMTATKHRLLAALLLLAGLAVLQPVRAAESYDACTGFIDSVPATISQQGVWCLRKDLSTNISSGSAITIATNNVTIDCNGFKLGGLAAGYSSFAHGIHAMGQQNISVRNCQLRGFYSGIALHSSHGSLVEDNRLDNNLAVGISLVGENNLVRRNRIYDTGGAAGRRWAYGIDAQADIIDNTVSGLFADAAGGDLIGIRAGGFGTQVRGNAVSRLESAARDGTVEGGFGIVLVDSQIRASDNHLAGARDRAIQGTGLLSESSQNYCANNSVGGFTTRISGSGACTSSNNLLRP